MRTTANSNDDTAEIVDYINSSMDEETASPPIHGSSETKSNELEHNGEPIVRQRPKRNAFMSSLINSKRVPTPSTPFATGVSRTPRRFSHIYKRLFQIMAAISVYIILVSSSGIAMRTPRGEKRFATQLRDDGSFSRTKSQSTRTKDKGARGTMSPRSNQLPVPDYEDETVSADDSPDESDDDSPDNSGDEKPISQGDGGGGDSMVRSNGNEPRKKLRPTLAYAKSLSNLNQDPVMYHYRDNINDADARYQNSELIDNGIIQRINRHPTLVRAVSIFNSSRQNEPSPIYDHHSSKDHGSYEKVGESLTILYRDVRSQIFISLVFLFIVIFMMDTIAREVKRRNRLPLLRQFMEYSMRQARPPSDRDSNSSI